MNLIEYERGKFVNLKYIVQISVHSAEGRLSLRRPASLINREVYADRIRVLIKTEGEAEPVEIAADYVTRFVKFFPEVGGRIQELETALFKAQVISALCRFPLAA
jgi:hypothetical protein